MQSITRTLAPTVLAIIALAVLALWPVLSPGMSADDYILQAYARLTHSPLSFFVEDHSSSYFYRPVAMLLWWLVAQTGPEAMQQYGLNIALHAVNALLVGVLAWQWTGRWQAMLLAGVVYAVHPSISATPMWLADRFDLSATMGFLAALVLLERAITRGRSDWLLPLAAFWAIGSKEIGVILPAVAVLRLLLVPAHALALRVRLFLALAVVLPVGLLLAARAALIRGVDNQLGMADLTQAAVTGIRAWWQQLPVALGSSDPIMAAVVATILVVALYGWWRSLRPDLAAPVASPAFQPDLPGVRALLLLGSVLLLPSMVQWPVTQLVLVAPGALENPANLRFYYLAFVAVALLIAIGLVKIGPGVALAASILVAAVGLPTARDQARNWAQMTAENDRPVAAAAALLNGVQAPDGFCLVQFSGLEGWPDHTGFFDSAIKSRLPRNSPWLRCVFLTSQAPWYSLLPGSDCDDRIMAPLQPRVTQPDVMRARGFDRLCRVYPQMPAAAEVDALALRWHWTGDGFHR